VEVRIVDENGQDKPDGEAGLVRVRTETMIHGYFNDPALTAAAFIDGWFHTADIGTRLAPDKLVVTGRADDVLNIGGLKFASSPIEARIKQIDGLNDAIVMNYARVDASATLVAAVETDNVPLPPDVEQKIVSILRRYTGGFEIMPLRKFPRTESGKIMRPAIEAAFRQHQAP
jgi:acyl-coenzyme A synthetase/AMP-(fatty) acid ligase